MTPLIYAQLYDWDNLWLAWHKAARGIRGRATAALFECQLENHIFGG